jgi:aminoglycoside 3-N-acetyltransferase
MDSTPAPSIRNQLLDAFAQIGLQTGDSLIVHSSLRSLAAPEVRASLIIDTLLDIIGPTGNLMFPTFNYTRPLPEPYYDPKETPCRTGILSEVGRKHPRAIRSLHPTHSVAVIGPKAHELTKDHLHVRAFGVKSPIDLLAQTGGKVLLFGVDHTSNSMIHVAEEHVGIPKVSWYGSDLPWVKILMTNGDIRKHQLDTSPSCSVAFNAVDFLLRKHGIIRDICIGSCQVHLMTGVDVINCVREMLHETPDILLCTWNCCKPCNGTRQIMREQHL